MITGQCSGWASALRCGVNVDAGDCMGGSVGWAASVGDGAAGAVAGANAGYAAGVGDGIGLVLVLMLVLFYIMLVLVQVVLVQVILIILVLDFSHINAVEEKSLALNWAAGCDVIKMVLDD